jgi:hypothetical protein
MRAMGGQRQIPHVTLLKISGKKLFLEPYKLLLLKPTGRLAPLKGFPDNYKGGLKKMQEKRKKCKNCEKSKNYGSKNRIFLLQGSAGKFRALGVPGDPTGPLWAKVGPHIKT